MNAITVDPVSRAMQETVRSTAVATIKGVALAKVRACEPTLLALAERYRDVVYDVSTTKGLGEAKAARHDLRENGRYVVQRAEQAVKDEANAVKKEIAPECERLIALVKPTEDALDKLIVAREAQLEAEKAAKRQAEAERMQKHRDAIAKIRIFVDRAKGLPASRIQLGIDMLNGMVFGEACEEFKPEYETALAETIAAMQRMHAETLASEQEQARLEAQRLEQERIAADLAEQKRKLDEQAAELARQHDELVARQHAAAELEAQEQQRAAAAATEAPATDTSASATTGTEVTPGSSQPEASPPAYSAVHTFISHGANIDGCKFEYEQDTTAQQEAGQAATQGTEANPSPCQAQTSCEAEAIESKPWGLMIDAPDTALPGQDFTGNLRGALRIDHEATPFYDEPADLGPGIEELAQALLDHIAQAFDSKFPTHPKPSQEWWQALKVKAASLRSHINDEA